MPVSGFTDPTATQMIPIRAVRALEIRVAPLGPGVSPDQKLPMTDPIMAQVDEVNVDKG